jgi:hypothetical protein
MFSLLKAQLAIYSGALALRCDEFLRRYSNVAGNLSQQDRRDVAPFVERHGAPAAVRMTELLVSAALPDLDEAKRYHFLRLQHRQLSQERTRQTRLCLDSARLPR